MLKRSATRMRGFRQAARLLQVIMLCGVAGQAWGENTARSIIEAIDTARDHPVAFTELRMSPLFAEPAQLHGTVEFSADGTLSKHVTEPFSERISISPRSVVLERNGKSRSVSVRKDSDLWEFYSGLLALLAGEPDNVNEYFSVTLSQPGPEWQLVLRPVSAALSAFMQEMTVKGIGEQVVYVRTLQADDNWQEIVFNHAADPAPLTVPQ